jgi:hypothetical protein
MLGMAPFTPFSVALEVLRILEILPDEEGCARLARRFRGCAPTGAGCAGGSGCADFRSRVPSHP